jgi:alkylated DNA repair protein (DNA oxidative demethylase)
MFQPLTVIPGFDLWPSLLDLPAQQALVAAAMAAAQAAPFANYDTAYGKAMSVSMTAFGPLGWTSDKAGYRYAERHPATDQAWPAMPPALLDLWTRLGDPETPPDSCLVNLYRGDARMGLHQDRDEADPRFPVLSISLGDTAVFFPVLSGDVSLGDTAVFRIGGGRINLTQADPTRSLKLSSGDSSEAAAVRTKPARSVDWPSTEPSAERRILAGSSSLEVI